MSTDYPTPKPTIDERLQAIVETLELVTSMQRDNDARLEKQFAEIAAIQRQDAEHINALVRIAEIHEHRLTGLEGGQE